MSRKGLNNLKSMTGYGTGRAAGRGFTVEAEVQTYNHRFLDIKVKLPPEYLPQEKLITKMVTSRLVRGRINVFIRFSREKGRYLVGIDELLARKYWAAIVRLKKAIKSDAEVGPEVLLGLPGVVQSASSLPSSSAFQRSVRKALDFALDEVIAMREREGVRLRSDLLRRVKSLRKSLDRIKARLGKKTGRKKPVKTKPSAPGLREQAAKPGQPAPETAPAANIEEELTRLASHIEQMDDFLKQAAPAGKTLEFICREILRETTTLGDKASDVLISREVILMKSEIESLREQIRNVE